MASQFVKIPASEAFRIINLCLLHAGERQHWEWGLYAPLGYLHVLAMSNLKIQDPNVVFMPHPQRFIMSTVFSENFPPQNHTHVIPDTTHALETLTTEHATTAAAQNIRLGQETKAVVPTSDPKLYLSHPGSLVIKTLYATLWEVKALDVCVIDNHDLIEPGGKKKIIEISPNVPWAETNMSSVLEIIRKICVEQILLQVLHTFHRHDDFMSVKLALVAGCYITVLLFKRPNHLARLPADTSVTSMMANKHRLNTKLAPKEDFLPTVLVPPRRMFNDDAKPSTALRFSLYTMYIKDVPGVSVNQESDIFHLADNVLQNQPFVNDAEFDKQTSLTLKVFTDWYEKHAKDSPPPSPTTPTEVPRSPGYIPHNTPSTNAIWTGRLTKRPRV